MTTAHIRTASGPLLGRVVVPPDKSISHRAVLFAALAEGTSMLTNLLDSADVRSTIGAVRALGAVVEVLREGGGSLDCTVHGWGALGPSAPAAPMNGLPISPECGHTAVLGLSDSGRLRLRQRCGTRSARFSLRVARL